MSDGLCLQDLQVWSGGTCIVGLSADIAPGEIVTVMGPSGIGKSTVLAALIGSLPPGFTMTGRVLLGGRDITSFPTNRRRIGILFQDDLLFAHLSVEGNLGFGLPPGGSRRDRRRRIEAALAEVGLAGFGDRDPATLSGGQKARVSLMRMLLSNPSALLLDEAFSRLDADRRHRTRRMVFDLAIRRRLPVLMVTHDVEDAQDAAGRIVRLEPPPDR